jgi:hypothetical protein
VIYRRVRREFLKRRTCSSGASWECRFTLVGTCCSVLSYRVVNPAILQASVKARAIAPLCWPDAVVEAAKSGDMTAARLILDRIAPPRGGGIARPARADDKQLYFPTVTQHEVAQWRAEFVENIAGTLDPKEGALAQRWRRENLSTSALPAELQPRWNRELTNRVRRLLASRRHRPSAAGNADRRRMA